MPTLKHCITLSTLVALVSTVAVSGRTTDTGPLFDVTVTGTGPAVVLVPGLATSGAVWDDTVAALKDRYELHVVTLAGFGGPPAVGAPFLPRVVDALVAYVEERRLAAPVVVGHSLGGYVAFAAAARRPAAFGGVVAVDGVPFLPALANPAATAGQQAEQAAAMRALYQGMTREQFHAQSRMALATMITAPEHVARAAAWSGGADPAAVGIAVSEMMTTDGRPDTARITAPVLLMGALGAAPDPMHDAFRQAYRAQVSAIPHAEVVFAERARHFIMLDDPAFFLETLTSFLARRAATPTGGR